MSNNLNTNNTDKTQENYLNISDKQTEILTRRLLPEIKKFFADENIQKEFKEWKKNNKAT